MPVDKKGSNYYITNMDNATHVVLKATPGKSISDDYENLILPITSMDNLSSGRVSIAFHDNIDHNHQIINKHRQFEFTYQNDTFNTIFCILSTPDPPTKEDILNQMQF